MSIVTIQNIVDNINGNTKATNVLRTQAQDLILTSKANLQAANGKGGVDLDWSTYDARDKTFKAYQKADESEEWQSISTLDFSNTIDPVKVLNIYPMLKNDITEGTFTYLDGTSEVLPKSASLKVWMEGGTYTDSEGNVSKFEAYGINPYTGQKILNITPIPSTEFNENPNIIWDYDVVMFGTWDTNGSIDDQPNDEAIEIIEQYIQSGYGVICGHDTIGYNYNGIGLSKLRKYFNIEVGYWSSGYETKTDIDYQDAWGYISRYIEIKRNGLLTNFPWELQIGAKLTVPTSHTCANAALGDVWMRFVDGSYTSAVTDPTINYYSYGKGNGYYYLTTYNNTAMIQTGHSNCDSTDDERKVLANALFYLKQRTNATSFTDNSAQDYKAPNAPIIEVEGITEDNKIHVTHNAQDNGSTYHFYVEAYSKSDAVTAISTSNETTQTVTTGTKGYYYIIDENEINDFNIADATYIENTEFYLNLSDNGKYVHMKAIDAAGNIGEVCNERIYIQSKVSINPNTGLLNENPDTVVKTGLVGETIELGVPEKEGHTFLAWSIGNEIINGTKYTFKVTDSEIIANWQVNKYEYTIEYREKETNKPIYYTVNGKQDYGTTVSLNDKKLDIYAYSYDSASVEQFTIGVDKTMNVMTIYYVRKNAFININYIDEQGNKLLETKIMSVNVLDDYTTKAEEIYGYELTKIPENQSGKVIEEGIIVNYIYKLKEAKVIVKYVDEKGKELAQSTVIKGKVFDNYTTEAKKFAGYEIITKPENTNGKMTQEDIIVQYEYILKNSKVIVKYIDENGINLDDSIIISGKVFDKYTTEVKTFKGYTLIKIPENDRGIITEEGITVEYIYKLKDARVIVKYMNEQRNLLSDDSIIKGKVFDEYVTEPKKIEGYELIEAPQNATGKMQEEEITVIYMYKLADNTQATGTIPQTGESNIIMILGVALIIFIIIAFIKCKKYKDIK